MKFKENRGKFLVNNKKFMHKIKQARQMLTKAMSRKINSNSNNLHKSEIKNSKNDEKNISSSNSFEELSRTNSLLRKTRKTLGYGFFSLTSLDFAKLTKKESVVISNEDLNSSSRKKSMLMSGKFSNRFKSSENGKKLSGFYKQMVSTARENYIDSNDGNSLKRKVNYFIGNIKNFYDTKFEKKNTRLEIDDTFNKFKAQLIKCNQYLDGDYRDEQAELINLLK